MEELPPKRARGWPALPDFKEPYRDEHGIPIAKSKQWRNWRKTPNLSFGEKLLQEIDPERDILTLSEHKKLCAIENGDQISNLLHADLGDALLPDLKKATEVFGEMMTTPHVIPPVILSLRFFTIAQYMLTIEDCRKRAKDTKSSKAAQVEALKICNQACKDLAVLVTHAQNLAGKLGVIDKLKVERKQEEEEDDEYLETSSVVPDLE